ncbi:hypothetical protein Tco_1174886 [Tanacetum coccineum]
MDQVTKHDVEQGTNDHKRKFDDRRNNSNTNYPNNHDNNNYPNNRNNNNYPNNYDNNNYPNDRNNKNYQNNRNNDYHQQQNGRQETFRTYVGSVHCITQDLALSGVRIKISPPKDDDTPVESPILISTSSSAGSSSPFRSTTPPPDYPFDKFILDNSLWIIPQPLGSELIPPKTTLTSVAPTMTQAAIRQIVGSCIIAALEAQAATMEVLTIQIGILDQEKLINYTEDCKVKFATGTLTEDALSWWNSYAKPIGIERADKIAWTELKRLLTNNYCPRTEVKKMEDEFYNLVKEITSRLMLEDSRN